jgi:hypothetical protein
VAGTFDYSGPVALAGPRNRKCFLHPNRFAMVALTALCKLSRTVIDPKRLRQLDNKCGNTTSLSSFLHSFGFKTKTVGISR